MTTALETKPEPIDAALIERVLIHGDLRQLTPAQKVSYYKSVCESVGLNPLTQPFQYLVLNGKEVLYARRDATEQLRQLHQVSIQIVAREVTEDVYVVTARATLPSGRQDENIGAVPIANVKGEARANAMMKAETKAKRRVTLAICGLGMLDETEVASMTEPTYSVTAPALGHGNPAAATRENVASPTTGEPSGVNFQTGEIFESELPSGAVRITRVDATPTKNKTVTRYMVSFSDGRQASTIKSQLASLCEQCAQDGTPVYPQIEQKGAFTNLIDLTKAPPADEIAKSKWNPDDHSAPITDDMIPF